jgi:hypothetical protein
MSDIRHMSVAMQRLVDFFHGNKQHVTKKQYRSDHNKLKEITIFAGSVSIGNRPDLSSERADPSGTALARTNSNKLQTRHLVREDYPCVGWIEYLHRSPHEW